MSETTCEEFHELSAEMALGVADARDRAAASAHLEHCASCRLELRELSDTADALTALTPAVEPSAGFESKVLARLQPSEQPVPSARERIRRRPVLAAAAAVVAVAVGAIGWAVGDQTSRPPAVAASHVVMATLAADHRPVGQVVIQTADEPWLSMAVSLGSGDSRVQCQLRAADGRVITVGWFSLAGGHGYWAAPIEASGATALRAVQVADAGGHVLASARLPSVQLAPHTY
jgi:hypothetical protein